MQFASTLPIACFQRPDCCFFCFLLQFATQLLALRIFASQKCVQQTLLHLRFHNTWMASSPASYGSSTFSCLLQLAGTEILLSSQCSFGHGLDDTIERTDILASKLLQPPLASKRRGSLSMPPKRPAGSKRDNYHINKCFAQEILDKCASKEMKTPRFAQHEGIRQSKALQRLVEPPQNPQISKDCCRDPDQRIFSRPFSALSATKYSSHQSWQATNMDSMSNPRIPTIAGQS